MTVCLTRMTKSGMVMPILGAKPRSSRSRRRSLADALFTKTQQRVMRVLFGQPRAEFLRIGADSGCGHGIGGRAARTCEAGGKRAGRGAPHRPPEALSGERSVASVFGTAEYR